jgi:hypothetical protein
MTEPIYYREPDSAEGRVGFAVYHIALHGRRGFRPDQIGIPVDDDVWVEIFEDIGRVAALPIPTGAAS